MATPEIAHKLQENLIAGLREMGLTEEQVIYFMGKHDQIMERFLREVNEQKAGYCPKCTHSWVAHDTFLEGRGKGILPEYNPNHYDDVYQCDYYLGMGDWCGCEERSRRPAIVRE